MFAGVYVCVSVVVCACELFVCLVVCVCMSVCLCVCACVSNCGSSVCVYCV